MADFTERDYERAEALAQAEREAALEAIRADRSERPREYRGVRYCLDCAEVIDPRRIDAQPRAVRCLECATDHERRRRQWKA
ncbi:TraR/DksA C4-type zinc finger protein [Sediminicurvatus halobius]|uniref:Conjugal transfer protein TraR n=1 Tax=Sediminicurvatus halobius TaxID=2182432 RepID=A0A2U2N1B3_9GAMM|nr:TraR/DksA C4-type zinc finger protein [Spiribacter halobius]PWG62843.1 conjugal transfer protein TraR [Spiribacter halobius]UEX77007.1 TraR/DksA C4-type zinc finger protein [Spiribacter halobius]